MTPTHTSREEVPSRIPHTSYDAKFYIRRVAALITWTFWCLKTCWKTVYGSAGYFSAAASTRQTAVLLITLTLDSIPILMKLPMMVKTSLTMSRIYQPLMNSILSPQLTQRSSLFLKNCPYSCVRRSEIWIEHCHIWSAGQIIRFKEVSMCETNCFGKGNKYKTTFISWNLTHKPNTTIQESGQPLDFSEDWKEQFDISGSISICYLARRCQEW